MSCNSSVAITWRNSENIRICKGEKYAISWQNHEDHFFNKYCLPKVLCLSFCLAHFALVFFFTELYVKRSKPEQPRKIAIIKHRAFTSFSFLPFLDLCSLRKHPFLLALRRWGRSARNIPSGEERGETDVFARYGSAKGG